jgi:hypothetical protein
LGIPALRIGSLQHESVLEIMSRSLCSVPLQKLREEGPYYLYEGIKESSAPSSLYAGYVDSCHFHQHAMREAALREVVLELESAL